ncbi:anthranilate synthase component I family protein [Paenibacillus protaetiae]|uniref:Anthranilate synthase component I family protein n=1 Tax=Paenibacillus protaetiae TaxID=2509456 RepID=A0A4P6FD87_9BACL|nr:anthranilate synthase component I family protein [Paenibacillus protaetiae]QAY68528.1 anthranilate synthase component I family protein [Paenibacillus protaetiae]
MSYTAWDQWSLWHAEGSYTMLPLLLKQPLLIKDRAAIPSWEAVWRDAYPYAFVLESGKDGRYTYLGLRPSEVIRGKGGGAESFGLEPEAAAADGLPILGGAAQGGMQSGQAAGRGGVRSWSGAPLPVIREWMSGFRAPRMEDGPLWTGGCAGYLSYDVARSIEKLPELAADDLDLPDYVFLRVNELWILDHTAGALYCAVHTPVAPDAAESELRAAYEQACRRAEQMAALWESRFGAEAAERTAADAAREERRKVMAEGQPDIQLPVPGAASPFPKEAFQAAVTRIQQYISQGDVFQANLSLRQQRSLATPPEELYEWLRLLNPSPYMGFMRFPDFQLVSASPELLVWKRGRQLATRPIAGTRRRGRTAEEDALMEQELHTNEKEIAEHIMLVDLERNDLGRIAAYGTVKVEELMAVERYSHVMHLVSQVEGQLADGKDGYDVIAATFPGGTITGAPKIRTMEIIEELEPVRRGPYTGSMGWIDYNGDMEFNIIIRTMVVQAGTVHIQTGAGIVIDSDPEREYVECMNKAKALWKAIQYSEAATVPAHEQA